MRRPARKVGLGSKPVRALLAMAVLAAGFAILAVRLAVTAEGYRLSELKEAVDRLRETNRRLSFEQAELSSRERLRALAPRYGLGPPIPGQVVVVP